MRTEQEFDVAFEAFKQRLDSMDDSEFFETLGTSIGELREKCAQNRVEYKFGMDMGRNKSSDYASEYGTLCA